ncbi:hypothetical protein KV205_16345 [Streptomyces sp. SKN60]|uniref:hypothetical protein n=1 Tax=Streptomyces sp. SKN60 TaxID=2855506 RepID=UPI0022468D7E|nr:hypothetical protein [Streptomyces sp. SKN60]MCX2182092.1 hypothetical protein [Streptomyces sp. SKN60]
MNRLRALAAAPFVLALAAHLLLLALWRDRLPDPLATHFSATDGGRADGFTGLAAYTAISSGLLLLLGAGWVAFVRRSALCGAWATAGFTGGLLDLLLRDNLDAADAAEVSTPLAVFTVAAGIGALAGLIGWGLTRLPRLVPPEPVVPVPPVRAPRLDLGAHELAGWSRAATSTAGTAFGTVFVVAGAGALFPAVLVTPWPYALIAAVGLVIGVPGVALSRVRVGVDRRGLTVTPALLPRPRIRIPLDEVASATVHDVRAVAEFGGWGYRTRPRRSALLLRSGEALSVRRTNGFEFLVTVADAETAAALLNTLAARDSGGGSAVAAPGERI